MLTGSKVFKGSKRRCSVLQSSKCRLYERSYGFFDSSTLRQWWKENREPCRIIITIKSIWNCAFGTSSRIGRDYYETAFAFSSDVSDFPNSKVFCYRLPNCKSFMQMTEFNNPAVFPHYWNTECILH